ncbi:cylicin-1 [Diorhabda carinulata]|uniref:cylicin-1 n=1 Tax=Diorhabda carinulata TaxID=1163345 RepID=UPI0025A1DF58|nr:cylicin-1 [Diorhabda carinulata]
MNLLKHKDDQRRYSKKDKQLMKLISSNAESEDENSEHELSYYLNDRVKMMKEILKIIKPRKIKSMAPDCMKSMDIEEINSMLLEELLGISNKRLKYIFNGQNLNEESSSTDPEDQSVDIISLDDISDDDLIIDLDSEGDSQKKTKKHKTTVKEEPKRKKIKKEKRDKKKEVETNPMSEKNLMSVLELLELQARARAIRSQLVLESQKAPDAEKPEGNQEDDDDEDAVIVESPKNIEIVITSSESENEGNSVHIEKNDENRDISDKNGLDKDSNLDVNKQVEITNDDNLIIQENIEEKRVETKENRVIIVDKSRKSVSSNVCQGEMEKDKTSDDRDKNNELTLSSSEETSSGLNGTRKRKKVCSKHTCRRKKLNEDKKTTEEDKSGSNNEDSIVLNVDRDDADSICLD